MGVRRSSLAVCAACVVTAGTWLGAGIAAADAVLHASPAGAGTACTAAEPCTLTQALASAEDGDRVVLSAGDYDAGPYAVDAAITLEGEAGSVPVVTSAEDTEPVLAITGASATVKNVKVTGGRAGGLTSEGADLTLRDVTISAVANGAPAIRVSNGSLDISGSDVSRGVTASGADVTARDVAITGGVVGIQMSGGSLDIAESLVTATSALSVSGGRGTVRDVIVRGDVIGIAVPSGSLEIADSDISGGQVGVMAGGEGTITDSRITGSGSGLLVTGKLGVTSSELSGNGAAVSNRGGETTLQDVTVTGNYGGSFPIPAAVFVQGGTVRVNGSAITNNPTVVGIFSQVGTVTVTDSRVSGNRQGIKAWGPLTVLRSTVSDNTADGASLGDVGVVGGIFSRSSATIESSTISGNAATFDEDEGLAIAAGGVFARGPLTIRRSTIADNTGTVTGSGDLPLSIGVGGIFSLGGDGSVEQSTIAGNEGQFASGVGSLSQDGLGFAATIVSHGAGPACGGRVADAGYNIDDDGTCGLSAANHSLSGSAPLGDSTVGAVLRAHLGTLGDYGGPTATVPLLPVPSPPTSSANPAAAAIPPGFQLPAAELAACSTDDQRGVSPVADADCAIGAFEPRAPDTAIESGPANGSVSGEDHAAFTYSSDLPEITDRFECALDGAPFAACATDGQQYTGLGDGSHSFAVRAVDALGNADPSPAERSFGVDTTAPDTRIDSGPQGTVATGDVSFTYSGDPAGDTDRFECALDGAPFAGCAADGQQYTGLGDGPHSFAVRAVDAVGNTDASAAERSFTVDTTPPDTRIDSGPDGAVATGDVAFTYSGEPADDVDGFECALDGAPFAGCAADGQQYTGLGDGPHSFAVRAVDAVGNADASPMERSFAVDTTPPDTRIDAGPEGAVASGDVSFAYSGDPAGDADGFECALDGAPFAACAANGQQYSGLGDGPHTFAVRAVDAVGNADASPAERSFTVDTVAPDTGIDSGPEGTVASGDVAFTYSGELADDVDRFECALDGAAFAACAVDGQQYTGLGDGAHSFAVRAVDAAGNADPSPAERSFTVDSPAPAPSPPSPPVGGAGAAAGPWLWPTKLQVDRAIVRREQRELDVLAPVSERASGTLDVQLHADGRVEDLGDAQVDSANRRVRFSMPLDAGQAGLGTGILLLTYRGDADTQPQYVRLRAAANPANLDAGRPVIEGGRIRATGTIRDEADGVVRIQILFTPAGRATRTVQFKVPIDDGAYRLDEPLAPDVLRGIATRVGGVHSYTLYTGDYGQRIRGEMDSFRVLGDR